MKLESIFLAERSMSSLVNVTKSSFGSDRETDSNAVQVKDIQYIPLAEQGIVEIRAKTFSGPNSNEYQTILVIEGVEYIDEGEFENSPSNTVFEIVSDSGNSFYIKNNQAGKDVKVRCTCEDFRWRFSPYNYSDQSLYGEPPEAYAKKTDRPSVNPSNTPGVCKHLIKLKKELEKEDFFGTLLN